MSSQRPMVWLLCALVAACATKPADAFVVAERALRGNDLVAALAAFDAVPVEHPRYPEARAAALGVEQTMRQGHELILEALLLRAQWRDPEALAVLRRVQSLWPQSPGVAVLLAATEQRIRLMGEPIGSAVMPPPAPAPMLEPQAVASSAPPAVPDDPATAEPSSPSPAEPAPAAPAGETPARSAPSRALGVDPVALGLVAVESSLGRGQLETAVTELLELARRYPDDTRVRMRLVRLLHQRALLRYGDGAIANAIADWRRVVALAPDHAAARQMLLVAEREGR